MAAPPLAPPLGARLATLRRDLRTVLNDLRGRRPPPFDARRALPRHQYVLRPWSEEVVAPRVCAVVELRREARAGLTIVLAPRDGAGFAFHAGQFLTLLVPLGAEVARRAYSICDAAPPPGAAAAQVAVTVKRLPQGLVSSHLHATLAVGTELRVLGPAGSFGLVAEPARARHVVLFGGGSGITPLMAIARTVLAQEPRSHVDLVYGNRARDDVIFRAALDALVTAYPDRFRLRHVLEEPAPDLPHAPGRLDQAAAARALVDLPPPAGTEPTEHFLCGPGPMRAAVRAALAAAGVPAARIHEERFTSPARRTAAARPRLPQPVSVRIGGRPREAYVRPGQTILEAGLAAGIPLKYSCTLGGCGACKLKVVAGAVACDEPNCLSAPEREAGWVLACVGHPLDSTTLEAP
jgi:ferredoxin-NADP reductase